MRIWGDTRRIFGILLAGFLLAGCFAIPVYFVYKAYETDKMVGIAVNINKPAPKVYDLVIRKIEKRKTYKIVERNDKDMVLSVQSIENEKVTGTITVSALAPRSSRFAVVGPKQEGVDPDVQKQEVLDSVLALCAELGHECTPEEPMK